MARPFTDIKLIIDGYFVKSRLKNCNYIDCIYHDLDTMQCELKEITMNEGGHCANATFDAIKSQKRMGENVNTPNPDVKAPPLEEVDMGGYD